MEKKWVVAYYTHYGDDWEHEYKEVFQSKSDAERFEDDHREEHKNVNGIEHISFEYSFETEKELRSTLTVNEYLDLFPSLKKLFDENSDK